MIKRVYTLEVESKWNYGDGVPTFGHDTLNVLAEDADEAKAIATAVGDNPCLVEVKVTEIWSYTNVVKYLMSHKPDDIYNEDDLKAYAAMLDD